MSRWLADRGDQELIALLSQRLGRVSRPPASFDQLASLLSAPQSCAEALRLLDRSAAQVIAVLAGGGGRSEPHALAAALGVEEPHVLAALQRAERLALAWPGSGGTWRTAAGVAHLARQVLERGVTYDELLMHLGMVELRALVGRFGLGTARSRNDALAVLEQVLPQRAAAALDDAAGAARDLTEMALSGDLPGDDAVVQDLLDRALLVRVQGRTYLPAEVEEHLRAGRVVLEVAREPQQQAIAPGPAPVAPALRLLAAAGQLLDVLAADPPKALVSGGLGVQVLRRLAKATGCELDELVLLLPLLATARRGAAAGVRRGRRRAGRDRLRGHVRVTDHPRGLRPRGQRSPARGPLPAARRRADVRPARDPRRAPGALTVHSLIRTWSEHPVALPFPVRLAPSELVG
ncbi:hypothetical protein BH24ACT10_BH24ACT10_17230 [soil metagenome]